MRAPPATAAVISSLVDRLFMLLHPSGRRQVVDVVGDVAPSSPEHWLIGVAIVLQVRPRRDAGYRYVGAASRARSGSRERNTSDASPG